ncbi:cation diffusion facilitator family transporter [Paenibacillus lutrae]|uniref:Cation diffusion facilitator family transporter n=1 Tax=Paenibacillus lutrae TaxID=2078573 RepID=A0A7X3JZ72_9BACL|nr:cation diffusion facilitator family transporter [Paenibacillus lutrae]MVO99767.1 cation diffusion facilitator family transporter [Paenibacillus lutrae]
MIAMWISLISNVLLTAIKLVVGWLFGSQVLIADGIHNAGDVIATATAYSSMKISSRPADHEHPYGHGKAEVLGSGAVALLLAAAAVYMGYHAVTALFEPPGEAHLMALIAAVISLVWKQWLYVYTIKLGRQMNSKGLIATAYDHLADVYASIAASVGIGLALAGDHFNIPFLAYGDPFAGIIVSLLVLKLAYSMGREAIDILMEKNVDDHKLQQYQTIIKQFPGVKRIDRLRAREHGHYILVDARIGVLGILTIQEGHDIGRGIKEKIKGEHPEVDEVLVHLNPWYPDEDKNPPDGIEGQRHLVNGSSSNVIIGVDDSG